MILQSSCDKRASHGRKYYADAYCDHYILRSRYLFVSSCLTSANYCDDDYNYSGWKAGETGADCYPLLIKRRSRDYVLNGWRRVARIAWMYDPIRSVKSEDGNGISTGTILISNSNNADPWNPEEDFDANTTC